jgi:hypothetical protein
MELIQFIIYFTDATGILRRIFYARPDLAFLSLHELTNYMIYEKEEGRREPWFSTDDIIITELFRDGEPVDRPEIVRKIFVLKPNYSLICEFELIGKNPIDNIKRHMKIFIATFFKLNIYDHNTLRQFNYYHQNGLYMEADELYCCIAEKSDALEQHFDLIVFETKPLHEFQNHAMIYHVEEEGRREPKFPTNISVKIEQING